jgi:hypothetical protein
MLVEQARKHQRHGKARDKPKRAPGHQHQRRSEDGVRWSHGISGADG